MMFSTPRLLCFLQLGVSSSVSSLLLPSFFVSVLFLLKERHKHLSQTDLIITYVLMLGAILIELYAVILLGASDWPWPHLKGLRKLLEKLFAPIINRYDKLID